MDTQQKIVFKAKPDILQVNLPDSLEFEAVKRLLQEKVHTSSKFFEGTSAAISFSGRVLSDKEENELIDIFLQNANFNIDFFDLGRGAKRKRKPDDNSESSIFYKGSVRSGQILQHEGSIVILGDVNAGGEITAYGNIVVLGKLRGTVHAGASGDRNAYIAAIVMTPVQIRIAELITYLPQPSVGFFKEKRNPQKPSIAYIAENQIAISLL